ncbi:MAG: alpha/beta hydrolase, partial [Pseudomonadota bacterium]
EKIGSDKDKMHLVGHSNAGSTALKLALRYPEAFESITVYEPTVFHIAGVENRIGNKLRQEFELMKEILVESKSNGGSDAGIKEFWKFWDDTEFWEQFSSDDQKEFSRKIGIVISEIERCFSEKWSLEDLRGLNIPVQVVMGMQSPLVFQNLAVQIVSALPAGRLTTLPMYGHFAPITHSEVINPLIIEHISDVEQRQKKKELGVNYPNKEQVNSNRTEVGLLNRIRKTSFSFFS